MLCTVKTKSIYQICLQFFANDVTDEFVQLSSSGKPFPVTGPFQEALSAKRRARPLYVEHTSI